MRRAIWIALVSTGCHASEPAPAPGRRCDADADDDVCVEGGEALLGCRDGRWRETTCCDECGLRDASGYACIHVSDGDDVCNCMPIVHGVGCGESAPPAPRCEHQPSTLSHCVGDTWRTDTCADVCAAQDPGSVEAGCFYAPDDEVGACVCARTDAPCTVVGYARCVDDARLACDDDGWWRLTPCDESCAPEASQGCVPDELGLARCVCTLGGSSSG